MKKRKGTPCIIFGLLLIAAALFLILYNIYEDEKAGTSAGKVLESIEKSEADNAAASKESSDAKENEIPDYILNPDMAMPTETVDGNEYIGVLEIPSIDLKLPIMSEWSYPNLLIAPCRYKGSVYSHNMIIAGHNYTTHFGSLKNLQVGDEVTFTDVSKNVFHYEVAEMEVLMPTAIEDMTSGDWDLTLFTCTLGGQSRVTIRCELKDDWLSLSQR